MFNPQSRNGLTLIELLVVIILLTTLVAAAIPVLAPADSDREIREATRGLNTYITGAQSRATLTRRPFGVAIKKLSAETERVAPISTSNPTNDNGVSLEVYYVEQQPPYTGFDSNSRCMMRLSQFGLLTIRFVTRGTPTGPNLPPGWVGDMIPWYTIRYGDVIEIGEKRYVLEGNDNRTPAKPGDLGSYINPPQTTTAFQIEVRPINDTGFQLDVQYDDRGRGLRDGPPKTGPPTLQQPYWTAPLPYKILRQPTKTADAPYQLPEGVAIDLRASGIGQNRFFHQAVTGSNSNDPVNAFAVDNSEPIYIMFTPEGRVERVSYNPNVINPTGTNPLTSTRPLFNEPVTDNIFLLLGKRENVPAPVANDITLDSAKWGQRTTDEQRQETKQPINWLNGESRWVVIGSQSGRVVSIENAFVDPNAMMTYGAQQNPQIAERTEKLRNEQILAAREFTREMSNMGGR